MNSLQSQQLTKSEYVDQRGVAVTSNQAGAANYEQKQSQFHGSETEVRALFDAFQKNGKVDLREFTDILTSTGVNKKCSILVDKINAFTGTTGLREVDSIKFANLFKFDLADRNDFMHTFKAIDKSQSFSIGPAELEEASKAYDLNLKRDDIKLMIDNLKQTNIDSVTADELYTALYK